jgi:hypothetical protein
MGRLDNRSAHTEFAPEIAQFAMRREEAVEKIAQEDRRHDGIDGHDHLFQAGVVNKEQWQHIDDRQNRERGDKQLIADRLQLSG